MERSWRKGFDGFAASAGPFREPMKMPLAFCLCETGRFSAHSILLLEKGTAGLRYLPHA
jgi:hypothetical protein